MCVVYQALIVADTVNYIFKTVYNSPGKRGMVGGPGPVGPPGYCQFCDALAMQANRQSSQKGP
jgi:hypothetical protein